MTILKHFNLGLKALTIAGIVMVNLSVRAVVWPNVPAGASTSAIPMTMLVAGKDHKLFYEAYNDASDVDGDGTLDVRFKPSITYYGLFDSTYCYSYSSTNSRFEPTAAANSDSSCPSNTTGKRWSGNWLNYMTTSRIDALRKVLYGGYREVDSTSDTVLRRAYIPQDAHSWGKEYHNYADDGYYIYDYTPLALPTASNKRHFFGNLTANQGKSCTTLSDCSDTLPPLLRLRTNVGDDKRIWEWASKERPVLHNTLSSGSFPSGTDAEVNYQVRVQVCTTSYHNGCKQYPNGGTPIYKPVGLLHDYGENNSMLFGLLTGSYDKSMSGGRLRKVMSSFADEVNSTTGQFNSSAPIVNTFDRLRIRDYNNTRSDNAYRGGWVTTRAMNEGEFYDWGNPVGEMLYEATRYLAGKKSPTSAYAGSTTIDDEIGLPKPSWDDPYDATSAAKAAYCSRASFLTISDINPSFDSDQLPGSYFISSSFTGDLFGLDVKTRADTITAIESNITGLRFIGESNGAVDSAPTAKSVTSLGTIRGLAPEEPTKKGSYYAASVAYYARTTDLRSTATGAPLTGTQTVDDYVVALSSPLPRIEAKLPSGKVITLVPFAKSVSGSSISNTKGNFQPTNQIVDFYVTKIANSGAGDADSGTNGGRYYAEFLINFEDVEQGADHDMDAISRYIVQANADNTLSVTVIPIYEAGGIQQNMGYIISGTDHDGVYLVARDETISPAYYLNVPPGQWAGYCDKATMPTECGSLPSVYDSVAKYVPFVFSASSSSSSATLLKDPLWYAAKYGGFVDRNNSKTPDLPLEWDADSNGVPDTYFLVNNPLKLKESLKKAFDNIIERNGSGGNVIANSTVLSTDALVFQATFDSTRWSGDVEAYPVTSSGVSSVAQWKASEHVPAPAARNIIYKRAGGAGRQFTWSKLSTAEKSTIGGTSTIVDYLRGDRTKEIQNGGTLRDRPSSNVLGDVSHSSPAFAKESNTVFIGANDGMLHAFDATSGTETFAFIPSSSLPLLSSLTKPDYNDSHQYLVDGDIALSSPALTSSVTYLVSTLGRGGKGLFGLNVSTPSTFSTTHVLWEYNATASDDDLGYMLGRPVITKLKSGTWAVVVGNGYNSVNGNAVLYVFNLATGALIRKIDTGTGGDNGLATPGVLLDTDGTAKSVYAGDLKGNVWKFDLASTTTSTWTISYTVTSGTSTVSPTPFFTAKYGSGTSAVAQPITAPITMAVNSDAGDPNYNKQFVYFGTGSDFQVGDPSSTAVQTWYGLIDEGSPITSTSSLVQRTVTAIGTVGTTPVRVFGTGTVAEMTGKSGFYLNLPESGERIVTAANYYKLAEPVLIASSVIPVTDVCEPGGKGYLNAINAFTGARLTKPFFDLDNNGSFTDTADMLSGAYVGSVDIGVGKPGESIIIGNRLVVGGSKGIIKDVRINRGITPVTGRLSWREIVLD